jgi:hypothetical protein
MDLANYSQQNTEMISLNNIHRLFNGYCWVLSTEYFMANSQYCPQICSVLSTELSMNIAQYCPRITQLLLLNTIRTLLNVLETALQNQISFGW